MEKGENPIGPHLRTAVLPLYPYDAWPFGHVEFDVGSGNGQFLPQASVAQANIYALREWGGGIGILVHATTNVVFLRIQ